MVMLNMAVMQMKAPENICTLKKTKKTMQHPHAFIQIMKNIYIL